MYSRCPDWDAVDPIFRDKDGGTVSLHSDYTRDQNPTPDAFLSSTLSLPAPQCAQNLFLLQLEHFVHHFFSPLKTLQHPPSIGWQDVLTLAHPAFPLYDLSPPPAARQSLARLI